MKKYLLILFTVFAFGQSGLIARQNFGKSVSVPTFNTYIGSVSSTITSASVLATYLKNYPSGTSFSTSDIHDFTIVGSDIKCRISADYQIYANVPASTTYYYDDDSRTKSLYNGFRNATALTSIRTTGLLEDVVGGFYDTRCRVYELPNILNVADGAFASCTNAESIYLPVCVNYGSGTGANTVFNGIKSGCYIYAHPSMATINAGGVEGDLAYAIANHGATVRYVANFTAPNAITTLAAGNIYNTAIQLNFTAPSSTNAIDYYELYVNDVYSKKIVSGDYVTGLTASTSYNFTIKAVDIFYNKSTSNSITQSTSSSSWDISTGLLSYYKVDADSKDNFRTNNGTNTSITYTTGKIGNASTYNGSSSIVTVADADNLSFNNASNDLPFSMSYWIYASNTQFSIINKSGASTREFECQYESGHINFRLISGGNVSNRLDQNYTISIGTSTWFHVVHTYSGGGSTGMKTYVNGSLVISTSATTGTYTKMSNTTNPLIFGGITFAGGYFLNGKLDEISIYNTELSAANVTAIYNSGTGITL